jgi:hypothetical protein
MKDVGLDPVVSSVIRTALYCCLAAGTALVLVRAVDLTDQPIAFNESSIIEQFQLIYLCVCMVLFFLSAKIKSSRMSLSVLLAGMALIALIRELDYFFDNYVFDGAWQTIAFLVALTTGFFVIKFRQGLKSSIQEFTSKASFGYMTSAFVVLFIFSRIIGKQVLWKAVMGENYLRVVKSFVEESTELFGYTLLLIAAIEFYRESKRSD